MQDYKETAMKKTEVKKLQLSRETLLILQDSDFQKVMGGLKTGGGQSPAGGC
jgi:hypothetical protein